MNKTAIAHNTSLRTRIIVVLGVVVTITAGLLAFGVLYMKEKLEEVIFENMVREQLQVLHAQLDEDRYDAGTLFKDWSFYYGDALQQAPAELRRLAPGSHHSVHIGDQYFQVEIDEHEGAPVALLYDITEWELQEDALFRSLAWSMALLLAVALLMGWQASRAILAPVRALTQRLAAIDPRQRGVRITPEFQSDEISQIARAFDQYLARLDQFVERERSFTAAASHELRTPLSVMLGALDILDSQPQSAPAARAIARLRRACAEMRAFIEATLLLAREESSTLTTDHHAPLRAIVEHFREDNEALLRERALLLEVDIPADYDLEQPESLASIVLGNLLRNAVDHTRAGTVRVSLSGHTLQLSDTGEGIRPEHLQQVFDYGFTTKAEGSGLGLNLVRRICDRFGWGLDISSAPGRGTTVTLVFRPPAVDPGAML